MDPEEIAEYLHRWQPPALMLWGRHDVFFDLEETVSWMKARPRMDAHILDGLHFLLETHSVASSGAAGGSCNFRSPWIQASATRVSLARFGSKSSPMATSLRTPSWTVVKVWTLRWTTGR